MIPVDSRPACEENTGDCEVQIQGPLSTLNGNKRRQALRMSAPRLNAGVNAKVLENRVGQIAVEITGDFFASRTACRQ